LAVSELSEKEVFFVTTPEVARDTPQAFPCASTRTPYIVFVAEFFLQRTPAEAGRQGLERFLTEFPRPRPWQKPTHDKFAGRISRTWLT
jgi:hypothetical protein